MNIIYFVIISSILFDFFSDTFFYILPESALSVL